MDVLLDCFDDVKSKRAGNQVVWSLLFLLLGDSVVCLLTAICFTPSCKTHKNGTVQLMSQRDVRYLLARTLDSAQPLCGSYSLRPCSYWNIRLSCSVAWTFPRTAAPRSVQWLQQQQTTLTTPLSKRRKFRLTRIRYDDFCVEHRKATDHFRPAALATTTRPFCHKVGRLPTRTPPMAVQAQWALARDICSFLRRAAVTDLALEVREGPTNPLSGSQPAVFSTSAKLYSQR